MKKLIVLAGAVALLVAAPAPARTAKTVAVDISKAGFVPASPSIQVGDSITHFVAPVLSAFCSSPASSSSCPMSAQNAIISA